MAFLKFVKKPTDVIPRKNWNTGKNKEILDAALLEYDLRKPTKDASTGNRRETLWSKLEKEIAKAYGIPLVVFRRRTRASTKGYQDFKVSIPNRQNATTFNPSLKTNLRQNQYLSKLEPKIDCSIACCGRM